jgi:hypothetical protein
VTCAVCGAPIGGAKPTARYCGDVCRDLAAARRAGGGAAEYQHSWPPEVQAANRRLLVLVERERFAEAHEREVIAARIRAAALRLEAMKAELLAREVAA